LRGHLSPELLISCCSLWFSFRALELFLSLFRLLTEPRIIGVQSFKGSLRRTCLIIPTLGEDVHRITSQFCGGHIHPITLNPTGYIQLNNEPFPSTKGYICPLGQLCKVGQFFDQFIKTPTLPRNQRIQSREYRVLMQFTPQPSRWWLSPVLITCVSSISDVMDQVLTDFHLQWSPVMYSVIDSDFYISCLFFIICIVVLNFWIINLFVAVITNSFAAIRSETRKSAFGATS